MAQIMNMDGVLDLLRELIEKNPSNLHNPNGFFKHLEETYNIAGEVVEGALLHYPNMPLIKEEVSLAAGLHDIGRPLKKEQLFHELRGAKYVEEHGLEDEITSSLIDIYRIAQMIRSHGLGYERFINPANSDLRSEFEPIDISLLTPRTWQEAIVTLSDITNIDGERLDIEERFTKTLDKYQNNPTYKSTSFVNSIMAGQERIYKLCERVKALSEGKLSESEIIKYGFL